MLAFDEEPRWVFQERVLKAGKREYIADLISRIRVGGGTDIFPVLAAGRKVLNSVDAQVKHVVLLSDGFTPPADFQGLATKMASEMITVTTVAVGASPLARPLAMLGPVAVRVQGRGPAGVLRAPEGRSRGPLIAMPSQWHSDSMIT